MCFLLTANNKRKVLGSSPGRGGGQGLSVQSVCVCVRSEPPV